MKYPKSMKTFERDDREPLAGMVDGFYDVLSFVESLQAVEKYGLSLIVIHKEDSIAWVCTDPDGLFRGEGWTPTSAVTWWEIAREKVYGEDDKPKLRLVGREEKE